MMLKTLPLKQLLKIGMFGISIVLLLWGADLFAGTLGQMNYYVAPDGSDNNIGTISAPFKTIQKAAEVVKPGDTVIVRDGFYTDLDGDDRIVFINSIGTADKPITFRSENKWGAVLDGELNTKFGIALGSNAAYLKLEAFDIRRIKQGIHIKNNSPVHDIHIIGNYFHDINRRNDTSKLGRSGIYIGRDARQIIIKDNYAENIGRTGPSKKVSLDHFVYFSRTDTGTGGYNIVESNVAIGITHAIKAGSDNTVIRENVITGGGQKHGLTISGPRSNVLIEKNTFVEIPADSKCIWTKEYWKHTNVVIRNNRFHGCNGIHEPNGSLEVYDNEWLILKWMKDGSPDVGNEKLNHLLKNKLTRS